MAIKTDDYSGICVLALSGDFITAESEALRKAVEDQIEKRQIVDFVIDLEKASFIDSEALETLLWLKRKSEDLFGQLKLANLDEHCRKILEITRLAHYFECHNDLPTALKTMR